MGVPEGAVTPGEPVIPERGFAGCAVWPASSGLAPAMRSAVQYVSAVRVSPVGCGAATATVAVAVPPHAAMARATARVRVQPDLEGDKVTL
ncbi:hypothetical protein GCM10018779_03080 [Streptomyces griseocarneus]|nr:hypothetical protein GCM10018779_03080 [Streptomyces griseocarneus]